MEDENFPIIDVANMEDGLLTRLSEKDDSDKVEVVYKRWSKLSSSAATNPIYFKANASCRQPQKIASYNPVWS